MKCGHINNYVCFELENCRKKNTIECNRVCSRKLYPCGHDCKRMCKIDCNQTYFSDIKKGYITPCKERVTKELPCGHDSEIDCGLPTDYHYKNNGCPIIMLKSLPCGHTENMICSRDPKSYPC